MTRPSRFCLLAVGIAAIALALPTSAGAHGPETPESYHWVSAPDGIDAAHVAQAASAEYGPELFMAGQAAAWTPDLQALVVFLVPEGQRPAVTTFEIEPLDPVTLPPLPDGGEPNGNAYRVTVDAPDWSPELRIQLRTPYTPTALWLRSGADGRWDEVESGRGAAGEIAGSVPDGHTEFVALASWEPPTQPWWQRITRRPALLVVVSIGAGIAGWLIGSRRRGGLSPPGRRYPRKS